MKALLERQVVKEDDIKTAGVEYGCQRYGVGRNTLRKLAEDADAVVKVGRRWLFNVSKVDKLMDELCK